MPSWYHERYLGALRFYIVVPTYSPVIRSPYLFPDMLRYFVAYSLFRDLILFEHLSLFTISYPVPRSGEITVTFHLSSTPKFVVTLFRRIPRMPSGYGFIQVKGTHGNDQLPMTFHATAHALSACSLTSCQPTGVPGDGSQVGVHRQEESHC